MSVYRDKTRGGAFTFEFDRYIEGKGRVRARKRLPKGWSQAEADKFDRTESARLYAEATGVTERPDAFVKLAPGEFLIEDAVLKYVEEELPNAKAGLSTAQELAALQPLYKGKLMSQLAEVCTTIKKMKRIKGDTTKPLAPATIRNRIRYLTSACRYGWKEHHMSEHDPAEAVTVPKVDNERQVYITRKQMLQIARACTNRKARMAIRIGYYSGMRLAEIFRAEPVHGVWQLNTTKNKKPRHIPIHHKVMVCARLFSKTKGVRITVQKNFVRARRRMGLDHVHFHDVRHSTASGLINEGVDLFTIGRILGHKDPRSTARYSHLETKTLGNALTKLG